MELRHLKYFMMVADELSFIKAANKLYISQPPLSRQIKELEDEIGVKLFNRNNKRVELTEAGKYFKKEIKQVFDQLEHIRIQTKKISENVSGEFRIAYISSTFSGDISELIKFLSEKFPFITFRLYETPTAKQILDLEQGNIDLGIIRGPIKSPKIDVRLWFKDSYSLVFNKDYLTLESEEDIASLKNKRFIFYNKEFAPHYYENLLQICSKFGFVPEVVHESNNISSILQLVKEGLGASILPTNVVKNNHHPNLEFLEIKSVPLFSEVLLATPKNNVSEITQTAIEFLQNH